MFDSLLKALRTPRFVLALALSTLSAGLVAGPLAYRALQVRSGEIITSQPVATALVTIEEPDVSTDSSTDVDTAATETSIDISLAGSGLDTTETSEQVTSSARAPQTTAGSEPESVETTTTSVPSTTIPEKPTTVSTGPGPEAPTTFPEEPTTVSSGPTVTTSSTSGTSAGTETTTTSVEGVTTISTSEQTTSTTVNGTSSTTVDESTSSTVEDEPGGSSTTSTTEPLKPDTARLHSSRLVSAQLDIYSPR